ncbi:MAG: molybdopterin-binding protein, partial [Thermodesulfovibrionales bacterium]|nr:molybdopterin-binding protein [Thermodesulfovibrionales bacterium]
IFKDDYDVIKDAMEGALQDSDMVLISGGTSAGTKDMTAQIIDDIAKIYGGSGVLFHGVSLKPGKPMIGGVVNNKPILGLPGHPAATVVCFDLFIRPVMERLGGLNSRRNFTKTIKAKMDKNIASAAGREDHIRVYLEEKNGELSAIPVLGKSGLITTLVRADGIVVIPQNKLGLDAGEEVVVKLF